MSLTIKTRRQVYIVGPQHPEFKEIKRLVEAGDSGAAYRLYKKHAKTETAEPVKKTKTPANRTKKVVKAAAEVPTPRKKKAAKAKAKEVVKAAEERMDSAPGTNPKAKFIVTADGVWFSTRKANYTVRKDHPFFAEIKQALESGDSGGAYRLYKKRERGESRLEVKGDDLIFDGKKFAPAFTEAYLNAKSNGAGYAALELFFENLSKNPNPISVEAFTNFLAKTRMPITDRGTFLAYRRCNNNYRDHHSGKFSNIPGSVCRMSRAACDSNQRATCSTGFHVCSHDYLGNFSGGPDLVVEINPRDVVAVPPDYNLSKMRVSSMRILSKLDMFRQKTSNFKFDCLTSIPFFAASQVTDWDVCAGISKETIEGNKTLSNGVIMSAEEWLALDPI